MSSLSDKTSTPAWKCAVGFALLLLGRALLRTRPDLTKSSAGGEAKADTLPTIFDHRRYRTTTEEIPGWLDPLYDRMPSSSTVFKSVLLGVACYLIGLGFSALIDFEAVYMNTLPIYLGVWGIAWTAGFLRYASRRVHDCYAELRPCFLIPDEEYRALIFKWIQRIWSRPANLTIALVLFALGALATIASFYEWAPLTHFPYRSIRPSIFGEGWFNRVHTGTKALIILFYGFVVALLLGPASRVLVINFWFLVDLRTLPVIPAAEIIRSRLRGVTNLYLAISFSWFVGVGLFGIVFYKELDLLSLAFLSILSLLGTGTFLTPQFIFRRYLASSYRFTCDVALEGLHRELGVALDEGWRSRATSRVPTRALRSPEGIESVINSTARPGGLVYDAGDFLVLIFGQLVTVSVIVLQPLFAKVIE